MIRARHVETHIYIQTERERREKKGRPHVPWCQGGASVLFVGPSGRRKDDRAVMTTNKSDSKYACNIGQRDVWRTRHQEAPGHGYKTLVEYVSEWLRSRYPYMQYAPFSVRISLIT
eukprot:scaffold281719_cov16-Prasinocladus_malaysianus.AAC.1